MVGRELSALGADVAVVHPREVATQRIAVRLEASALPGAAVLEGRLDVGDRTIDLPSITGVYARPIEPELVPELARLPPASPALLHARLFHESLLGFTEVAELRGCRVANRVSAMASNMSKPFQAQTIVRHGFSTPATLVSDDPEDVLAFAADRGELVYKSTSGVRSIVATFDPTDRSRLERLRWCPVQFQERIRGPDVRVHVVGDSVFAVLVRTEAVDYRYARAQVGRDAELHPYVLPAGVAERCVALAAALDLPFAGIDLKLPPDGRVICFEVNPSPGFPWYEQETGLPIAAALARWLLGLPPAA
jgi:glutathione synthase/RimK-type ligase-like ATP-grasp enzyme